MSGQAKTILVSILSLGRPQNVLNQLADLPAWLDVFERATAIAAHIVVRNNDPAVDFAAVADRMTAVQAEYPAITCTLVTGVPNNGFGAGHNSNIALAPSDYVLILNDDIGFPHIAWLGEAVRILEQDAGTACVGATENPKQINPFFGNGLLPNAFQLHSLPYAEASILLFSRSAFDRLGGFAADFRWAMCEDSDLSLRVQQHGMRLAHISMPHEHWRSTSFNALPGAVKSSILEHNRAAFFANWHESLTAGRVGRFDVYDIWSDGLGDVFCALPHLLARLAPLSPAQRAQVIVNTSHPDLVGWLGLDGIRITSLRELGQLRAELHAEGIAALRSMRDVNFSLPFNIHPLLAGALGIDQAGPEALADFARRLRGLRPPRASLRLQPGTYCVVHLEFDRNHDGRGLPPAVARDLLTQCGMLFERVVLVGRERRLSAALLADASADIVDLQGALSMAQLASVISQAKFFVGIDSFPSHIAQACGVPAAIFFGAIHPLARAWNESLTWPLTADLDCIGCYHTHLEPSVPFCMRRDTACTGTIATARMRPVLQAMIAGTPFDWSVLRVRLQSLQARLIKLARYHPAPPERLFRAHLAGNEQISNMIYRMTDQMGNLLRGQYHTSAITQIAAETQSLRAELFAARVALDETARSRPAPPRAPDIVAPPQTTRILQLNTLSLAPVGCHIATADQWIEVDALDDDPQVNLPPLQSGGGKVQLRLSCTSELDDMLQVYWASYDAPFSPEQVHTLPTGCGVQTANLVFDLAEGEILRLRIDPTTGIGRARLRGSIGGLFELLPHDAQISAPPVATDTPATDDAAAAPAAEDRETTPRARRPTRGHKQSLGVSGG